MTRRDPGSGAAAPLLLPGKYVKCRIYFDAVPNQETRTFHPNLMRIQHIFIDMDGVLVDFVSAALQLHDRPELLENWPPGEWDIARVLGISRQQFWRRIDRHGGEYWSQMPAYAWLRELIELIGSTAPFTVLSSPSLHPECAKGKIEWLQQHLGRRFRDYLIGHQKHLCAKPGTVLIDDSDLNVWRFRQHGGCGILFPQPWNAHHDIADRLSYVRQELQGLREPNEDPPRDAESRS